MPRWGLGDAAAGLILGVIGSTISYLVVVAVSGHTDDPENLELQWVAIAQAGLWLGLLGVPLWASATKGAGVVKDYGLRMLWWDPPLGAFLGVVSQYVLLLLIYVPLFWLTDVSSDDVSEPARELSDKATNGVGIVLLVLIVGIGAPIVEEIFFRGLVQRSLLRRMRPVAAIAISSLIFGATHFELIQFPALVAFGAVLGTMAYRTGRLGLCIWAHVGFNMITVVSLLNSR